jgi:hypothetical protein
MQQQTAVVQSPSAGAPQIILRPEEAMLHAMTHQPDGRRRRNIARRLVGCGVVLAQPCRRAIEETGEADRRGEIPVAAHCQPARRRQEGEIVADHAKAFDRAIFLFRIGRRRPVTTAAGG